MKIDKFSKLIRFIVTVSYLRSSQIFWRLIRLLPNPLDYRKTPNLNFKNEILPFPYLDREGLLSGNCFEEVRWRFLAIEKKHNDIGWKASSESMLWRYNLHYMDFLSSKKIENELAREIYLDWILKNPKRTNVSWDSYPLSLRIVNTIKWLSNQDNNNSAIIHSLYEQSKFLEGNLEYHLRGNHLLANIKALIFASVFFGEDKLCYSQKYLKKLLLQQIKEQILDDGGHFELSPMYHSIVLEDLLDIASILKNRKDFFLDTESIFFHRTIKNMLDWLSCMCFSDGEISFFNDASFGIAQSINKLKIYYEDIFENNYYQNDNLNHLKFSGYFCMSIGNMKVISDCAKIGPDYLPGHGHADTLSFELSVGSQRIFINTGCSEYGNTEQRSYERSTMAHNTVTIDKKNSSEVWGGFRVGRRAKPKLIDFQLKEDKFKLKASHSGYSRLGRNCIHVRSWTLEKNSLQINDEILGNFEQATAVFILNSDLICRPINNNSVNIYLENSLLAEVIVLVGNLVINTCEISKNFGELIPSNRLEMSTNDQGKISTSINIF